MHGSRLAFVVARALEAGSCRAPSARTGRGVNELKPSKEWLAELEDTPERASPRADRGGLEAMFSAVW